MTHRRLRSVARFRPARPWRLSVAAFLAGCAAGAARAATPAIAFNVPPGPLSAELVKFAVEANISIGLEAVGGCTSPARGLAGRYTVEEGLQRILKGSGCAYRR